MLLTLAHSPDPDDAFMWWPITGKVRPDGTPLAGEEGRARIDTGGIEFRAVPADIEVLNRRAAAEGDLDITALSFRAWCDVKDRYAITHCGSSFGEGFGPKVVAGTAVKDVADLKRTGLRIAIPGRRTTAFLLLSMLLGPEATRAAAIVEMPFEQVIGAVARGEVDAGVVIHEGQLLFADAGLHLVVDLGQWWGSTTGLPVPLGCNALRLDLDARFGEGTIAKVSRLLRASIDFALANRAESLEYTMPFALANAAKKGATESGRPTLERVDRYVAMYVNRWTVDMGVQGREAVRRLLAAGHAAGLSPDPGEVLVV
ncbi:MAG: MqnA/MqnD/SBP family protein [Phycisphaerae bacterium]|jgi:1,4-dihydroxy-6-naphthoate synthase